jgi:XRE family transcriptional regulator, regulator of sulfur utilization
MEQNMDSVAENLRVLRESRGLSLDQLAELTGVSKSMLRQIEMAKSSPTIATIWKIANGLRISFTSLLCKPVLQAEVKSFRAESPLTDEDKHYRLFPLIPFSPEQPFETYYLEIDPGTVFNGEPHQGNVYEYIFLNQGKMRVTVGEEEYQIGAGEFLQFQAGHRHRYECLGEEIALAIMQVCYR